MQATRLIVGIGGAIGPNSTSERIMGLVLDNAAARGWRVAKFGGPLLADIPHYDPASPPTARAVDLVAAVRDADAILIATPSYHGGVSGLVKNALDTLQALSVDRRPYLDGRVVGCVVTAGGPQACGTTLSGLRDVIHALRGWPTPASVTVTSATPCFDPITKSPLARLEDQIDVLSRHLLSFVQAQPTEPL